MKKAANLLVLFGVLTTGVASAAPCATGSLFDYIINYAGAVDSCSIGILNYSSFGFKQIAGPSGSPNFGNSTVNINSITVSPLSTGDGLNFYGDTPSVFNRIITTHEQYLISYLVDPPPVVAGDELFLDPPTGPITVSKWTCPDGVFDASINPVTALLGTPTSAYSNAFSCLNKGTSSDPYFLQVTPSNLADVVTYASPASFVSVRLVIDLYPDPDNPVKDLFGIESRTVIPEPAAFAPLVAAVFGVGAIVRRRRKNKA